MKIRIKLIRDILVVTISLIVVIFGIIANAAEGDLWVGRLKYIVIPLGILSFLLLCYYKSIKLSYLVIVLGNIMIMAIVGIVSVDPIEIDVRPMVVLASICASYFIAELNVSRKIFYPVALISFIIIVIMTIDYIPGIIFGGGLQTDDRTFREMSSQNAIGSWLVTTAATLTIVSRYEKNITPLWPSLIAFILSIGLYSRSNVVTSGIVLISVLLFDRRYKTIIMGAALYFIFNYIFDINIYELLLETTRFGQHGVESSRFLMWDAYITSIDATSFIFGLSPEKVPFIMFWSGNPHSSLIRLFGYFGIYPFILLIFWVLIKKSYRIDFVAAGCLFAIIARSMTDVMFLAKPLDLYFFIVFLIFLQNRPNCSNKLGYEHQPASVSQLKTSDSCLIKMANC